MIVMTEEVRNSKLEIRSSKQTRSSKFESVSHVSGNGRETLKRVEKASWVWEHPHEWGC
jgi:hypothetical protein